VPSHVKLSSAAVEALRCPRCHSGLVLADAHVLCSGACGGKYPVIESIPVIINEANSVFTVEDFAANRTTTLLRAKPSALKNAIEKMLGADRYSRLKKFIRRSLPTVSRNIRGKQNYARLAQMLAAKPNPRVLILGGGILGDGLEVLVNRPGIDLVESDVSFGPRTKLICDAHDVPFVDGSFDCVISQAVLEHVVDPYRCVAEIHRVLKDDGLIYAETPFMQQVHAGRYDFTRFTHLGHRRLFRQFEEIASGIVCGPGMTFAWGYQYFLMSFARSQGMRRLAREFANWTAFWLKYFDYFLVDKPGATDSASGFYLLGRKSTRTLPDRELLALYRGTDSIA